jgi:hypothetical protein
MASHDASGIRRAARMRHTVRCDNIAFCRITDASRAEGVAAGARAGFALLCNSQNVRQEDESNQNRGRVHGGRNRAQVARSNEIVLVVQAAWGRERGQRARKAAIHGIHRWRTQVPSRPMQDSGGDTRDPCLRSDAEWARTHSRTKQSLTAPSGLGRGGVVRLRVAKLKLQRWSCCGADSKKRVNGQRAFWPTPSTTPPPELCGRIARNPLSPVCLSSPPKPIPQHYSPVAPVTCNHGLTVLK